MSDKNWAQSYLIDPLTAPVPSEETGPGSHFRSTFAPASTTSSRPSTAISSSKPPSVSEQYTGSSSKSKNPYRRSGCLPTPPHSSSPRKENFDNSYREEAFSSHNEGGRPTGRHRRSSSLTARYPGDESHRPLDIIRRDSKKAYRSPHLHKRHMPGTDMIDNLDIQPYHHEGPYDAVLLARNTSFENSPVAAVAQTNAEAIKATPKENIRNSLRFHRPLDGTASIPSGIPDQFGRVLHYEEGTDLMRDSVGNYKRWPGEKYHPDDLKGKGEPNFSIDRALQRHKETGDGIEMKTRPRNRSMGHSDANSAYLDEPAEASGVSRRNTTGKRVSSGLRRTFGSLRRKKQDE